ncbi:MAG: ATP-binding protein [Roseovarius sp.]
MSAQIMTADMTFECRATPVDVRRMLGRLRTRLAAEDLSDEKCSTIEIALAEALNNIVEHAYRPDERGAITLTLSVGPRRLTCELRDLGVAMPGLGPPDGTAPDVGGLRATLPEGGFGWSLIRALTARLHYMREGTGNRLILDFDIDVS